MKIRCIACTGSGKVMGGGMMFSDCDECDGTGKIYKSQAEKHIKKPTITLDKRSKHYRDAVIKIMNAKPDCSYKDAKKIFDAEFESQVTEA